jgi:hypothetical protein
MDDSLKFWGSFVLIAAAGIFGFWWMGGVIDDRLDEDARKRAVWCRGAKVVSVGGCIARVASAA